MNPLRSVLSYRIVILLFGEEQVIFWVVAIVVTMVTIKIKLMPMAIEFTMILDLSLSPCFLQVMPKSRPTIAMMDKTADIIKGIIPRIKPEMAIGIRNREKSREIDPRIIEMVSRLVVLSSLELRDGS